MRQKPNSRLAALLDAAKPDPALSRQQDREANVTELQRLCYEVGARAKRRGLTEKKLNLLLADDD
jgi:hypothetical protein